MSVMRSLCMSHSLLEIRSEYTVFAWLGAQKRIPPLVDSILSLGFPFGSAKCRRMRCCNKKCCEEVHMEEKNLLEVEEYTRPMCKSTGKRLELVAFINRGTASAAEVLEEQ